MNDDERAVRVQVVGDAAYKAAVDAITQDDIDQGEATALVGTGMLVAAISYHRQIGVSRKDLIGLVRDICEQIEPN